MLWTVKCIADKSGDVNRVANQKYDHYDSKSLGKSARLSLTSDSANALATETVKR